MEVLESDFAKAKGIMSEWEWTHGGYEALYNSQKRRLQKEIQDREDQMKKSLKSKK